MIIVFLILLALSTLALIVGMIKPNWVVFWSKKKTRKSVLLYFIPFFLFGILFIGTMHLPKSASKTPLTAADKLEKEAIKANFVKMSKNVNQYIGTKVYATGKITSVDYKGLASKYPTFMLSQKESNGYGIYYVYNMKNVKGLKDGDTVKIYGTIKGTDKLGFIPSIAATIVKKEK